MVKDCCLFSLTSTLGNLLTLGTFYSLYDLNQ